MIMVVVELRPSVVLGGGHIEILVRPDRQGVRPDEPGIGDDSLSRSVGRAPKDGVLFHVHDI